MWFGCYENVIMLMRSKGFFFRKEKCRIQHKACDHPKGSLNMRPVSIQLFSSAVEFYVMVWIGMAKLFEIKHSRNFCNNEGAAHYIVANNLSELISKGKSAFHLDGECGLYNNHGTRVESDQVLDLLEKSGYIMFFIREIDIHEQIITHDVPEMPEPAQQPNVFVDPSPSTSSAESSQVETTDFYPVLDILRGMRVGKRAVQGDELIKRVLATNCCDLRDRKMINKAVGSWLMFNCTEKKQYFPSWNEYEKMAKSVVHALPSTKHRNPVFKPWVVWFDREEKTGTLEVHVRQKRCRDGLSLPRDTKPLSKRRRIDPDTCSEEEIREAEDFMRRTPFTETSRNTLLDMFKITQKSRREWIQGSSLSATEILMKYRLLQLSKDAIEDDFQFICGSTISKFVNNWSKFENNILLQSKLLLKNVEAVEFIDKCEKAKAEYEMEKYFYWICNLVLAMLPDKRPGAKRNWASVLDSISSFIQLFPEDTPISSAVAEAQRTMIQPGILKIGEQYFLKVEKFGIPLPDSSLVHVIGYLIAIYYVLDLKYPKSLHNSFIFFELMFDVEVSRQSNAAKQLYGIVSN